MKKLIILISVVSIALLSTFPVKESLALPEICTTKTNSDGSSTKTCAQQNGIYIYDKPCAYCNYSLTAYYPNVH